jgi:dolichyl-phosphate beta-glucosyltransferase
MLSVVIPAYNEETNIQNTIETLIRILRPLFDEVEIIVVDDGSIDLTAPKVEVKVRKFINDVNITLIKNGKNRGKGFSIKSGVLSSAGDTVIFIDADLSYDADSIIKIASGVSGETPILIGSRNLPTSEILTHVSLIRFIFGRVFSLLIRLLVLKGIADTQCGLKGFKGELAHKIFPLMTIDGFAFDVEFLYISRKYHYDISMIPVNLVDNRKGSRVNMVVDPVRMVIDLIRIRLNDWAGKYE